MQKISSAFEVNFIGLDTQYEVNGVKRRRHYLDSAATTLMMASSADVACEFLSYYANPHTKAHFSARIASNALNWARGVVKSFLGADDEDYAAIFIGTGTTSCANRLAFALHQRRPDRSTVLVSAMEHHSNDLPHRRYSNVVHIPLDDESEHPGGVSLAELERLLCEARGAVNYVAVTGVSNVTGVVNPIHDIAELAHAHDALVVVDGAQMVAHMPVSLSQSNKLRDIDAFIFSGHKIYAPGSPGVLVIKKHLLEDNSPLELGGGIVQDVTRTSYVLNPVGEGREEAGTPNLVGIVTLAASLEALRFVGMASVSMKEQQLMAYAQEQLRHIKSIDIYGPSDSIQHPRIGCLAFNLSHVDHGFVATLLNDEHNIAVRNGCFCAHPYVRALLKEALWNADFGSMNDSEIELEASLRKGMVRASFGAYSNKGDVDALIRGLLDIEKRAVELRLQYSLGADGTYERKQNIATAEVFFNPKNAVKRAISRRGVIVTSDTAN